jgi:hypothetical protein
MGREGERRGTEKGKRRDERKGKEGRGRQRRGEGAKEGSKKPPNYISACIISYTKTHFILPSPCKHAN